MRIVSNASPLIFLSKIDSLGLLPQCFSEVLMPPAVAVETGMDLPDFIRPHPLSEIGEAFVRGAIGTLHRGELEALTLARELAIDLVAIDDRAARRKAVQMGLKPIGTVGLLVLACRMGHLDEATALDRLEQLVGRHGLYVSGEIMQQVRSTLTRPGAYPTEKR